MGFGGPAGAPLHVQRHVRHVVGDARQVLIKATHVVGFVFTCISMHVLRAQRHDARVGRRRGSGPRRARPALHVLRVHGAPGRPALRPCLVCIRPVPRAPRLLRRHGGRVHAAHAECDLWRDIVNRCRCTRRFLYPVTRRTPQGVRGLRGRARAFVSIHDARRS